MGGEGHHHEHHGDGAQGIPWDILVPAAGVLLLTIGYLLLVRRARARNRDAGWNPWRTAAFTTGCVLLSAGTLPPIAPYAHEDFRGHMLQHMVIGMYAPLALVLGAPFTLLLRTLPTAGARRLTRVLRGGPARVVAHPVTALLLSSGSLVVLYFTPLYEATARQPFAHWLLHVHFLLSGCLFAWVIAGPDPAPHRPGVPARLVVLGVAIAAHAIVAQLVYGGFLVDVHAPVDQMRGAGQIMYYGGDVAELLLAAALVNTWRPTRAGAVARSPVAASTPVGAKLPGGPDPVRLLDHA